MAKIMMMKTKKVLTSTITASVIKLTTIRTKMNLANSMTMLLSSIILILNIMTINAVMTKEYYYTRTRNDPQHLRISETLKNSYVSDIKYESKINGTMYEYYVSSVTMSHDELVFEVIDKMFRHRLSPFYIHHYDNEEDKRTSSDSSLVSQEACARDLLYLVDKLPKRTRNSDPFSPDIGDNIDDPISPELNAFFDSYAKQEPGLLMGNTYWVGAYDQCVNRQIFELTKSTPQSNIEPLRRHKMSATRVSESEPQVVSFRGRYCVASLKSPVWDKIIETRKSNDRYYFKSDRQIETYARLFRLQLGICLPSTCDSYAYERHHDEIKLLATAQLDQRFINYDFVDLYCLPDESSQLRRWSSSAKSFIAFMAIWLTGIFLATVADVFDFVNTIAPSTTMNKNDKIRNSPSTVQKLVTWLSLKSNYKKLMLVKHCDDDDDGDMKKERKQRVDEDDGRVGKNDEDNSNNSVEQRSALDGKCLPKSSFDLNSKASSSRNPNIDKIKAKKLERVNEANTETVKINLRFLNAFKVIIMFWIVNGHIMLLMIQTAKNILYSDALLNGLMHFLIGATFGVDLFFTMTGFLAAYLIFNSGHANRMKPTTWLYMFFHRYWRLAPMYLLTFWFSRSVMQLLGSGPLWDYGTSSITFRGLCNQESWWYPMTLTSNLHGLFEECMIQSWYISCDMQFWLVSPIFIYLLAKKPSYGWAASIASIMISSKKRFDIILADKSARYDELVKPRADIFMRVSHDLPALYTHPQYRIGAYIVGMLAGHYVYMIKSGRWSTSLLSKPPAQIRSNNSIGKMNGVEEKKSTKTATDRQVIAYLGVTMVLVMSFVSYLLSNYYPYTLIEYAKIVAASAYAIDHLVMSAGFSLVIISMCFGQWPNLVSFLSHPNWTRLSKINYAILLLQCEAIYYQIFRYDQVPVAGTKELTNILFNLLVTLYPIAFAVTLIFEFPLANIEKLLI